MVSKVGEGTPVLLHSSSPDLFGTPPPPNPTPSPRLLILPSSSSAPSHTPEEPYAAATGRRDFLGPKGVRRLGPRDLRIRPVSTRRPSPPQKFRLDRSSVLPNVKSDLHGPYTCTEGSGIPVKNGLWWSPSTETGTDDSDCRPGHTREVPTTAEIAGPEVV